jgi:N-methylhydantoinase A
VHDRVYAVRDEGSLVECVNWRGRLSIALGDRPKSARAKPRSRAPKPNGKRRAYFGEDRAVLTPIFKGGELKPGDRITGPAIIEEATTTIVVYPKMTARVSSASNYILESS